FEAVSTRGWQKLLDKKPARFSLTINCRNTKPVAVAAQILSGVPWEETLHVSGPDVEQHFVGSREQERQEVSECVKRWLADGIQPQQIVVLSHKPFAESVMGRGLIGA